MPAHPTDSPAHLPLLQHVYIPILPEALIDMVSSPTPYLVGISPQAAKRLDTQEIEEVIRN